MTRTGWGPGQHQQLLPSPAHLDAGVQVLPGVVAGTTARCCFRYGNKRSYRLRTGGNGTLPEKGLLPLPLEATDTSSSNYGFAKEGLATFRALESGACPMTRALRAGCSGAGLRCSLRRHLWLAELVSVGCGGACRRPVASATSAAWNGTAGEADMISTGAGRRISHAGTAELVSVRALDPGFRGESPSVVFSGVATNNMSAEGGVS
ncbi:hypothetical protein F5B19DRAFT_496910 [Rostrohypoxylon terebratum]|nr:hypothetical protein F5B19DRAFT_496910 [Rostrohypoxylon terebratum]